MVENFPIVKFALVLSAAGSDISHERAYSMGFWSLHVSSQSNVFCRIETSPLSGFLISARVTHAIGEVSSLH